MISEGSRGTDWRYDAEHSDLHYRNKLHFKIYSNRKQLFKIIIAFKNIEGCFFIFHKIIAVLVSISNLT